MSFSLNTTTINGLPNSTTTLDSTSYFAVADSAGTYKINYEDLKNKLSADGLGGDYKVELVLEKSGFGTPGKFCSALSALNNGIYGIQKGSASIDAARIQS